MNSIMYDGKQSAAENKSSMARSPMLESKTQQGPLPVFEQRLEKCSCDIDGAFARVGAPPTRVPVDVRSVRPSGVGIRGSSRSARAH